MWKNHSSQFIASGSMGWGTGRMQGIGRSSGYDPSC